MAMGDATVLVVDDEPSLRLLCRVNLELEGFLVLDVHIAGEDGRDLLDELRAADSPVRVTMLTGSADLRSSRFDGADRVLAKPFEPVDLIASVRELAEGARVDSST